MHHRRGVLALKLTDATDIAGGHAVRLGRADIAELAFAQLARDFWLKQIVGACRPAAQVCVVDFGELEPGAREAAVFNSGMAAITTLAMTLKQGDRVLLADDVYGGTYRLFSKVLIDLGISFERVAWR